MSLVFEESFLALGSSARASGFPFEIRDSVSTLEVILVPTPSFGRSVILVCAANDFLRGKDAIWLTGEREISGLSFLGFGRGARADCALNASGW